jgi:ComF family protein
MALINDFLSLIYPRHCEACSNTLFKHELFICNHCKLNLPKSNYHLNTDNELNKLFSARIPLANTFCFYLYEKSGKIQKLLHAIKYQNQKELGEYLGALYGEDLLKNKSLLDIDLIIPIPLHKNKLKTRGYNQSEWFARGLSKSLKIELETANMERITDTATQTNKKKYERWENVEGIFKIHHAETLQNKHILVVDDVITTGATIEAAWLALKDIEGIRVSVVSIAFASKN